MPEQSSTKKKAVPRKGPGKTTKKPDAEVQEQLGFPIVALGASAGGLEAFELFFSAVPRNTGIAFILLAHLDPTHVSLLPELVQKHSTLPVHKITDGMKVMPDNLYVIPPNKNLSILNGKLQLMDLTKPRGANLPIDSFFRSLARDQGRNAICIVLSGTGTDGTLGLKAVKGGVGMVMAQDEDSAKYDGMPRSAISTGLVDYILPPQMMPEQLLKYTRHPSQSITPLTASIEGDIPNALQKIYIILRTQTDHDFSLYKKNTIYRRIERRMNVHQIENIDDYVRYLQDSDREVNILFKELLIGVTHFFRDSEIFETLRDQIMYKMHHELKNETTIRVWVAGCSSGEEAYSLAIILHECMSSLKRQFNIQVFATDIDEEAISFARAGVYPASIQADVSAERLKRYFSKIENGQFQINTSIREMVVFALQNIIQNPPFTKLDILSCRNLLIYLEAEVQKKLIPVFHYSLKREGILILGSSESIGQTGAKMFSTLDKKGKIFARRKNPATDLAAPVFPVVSSPYEMKSLDRPDTHKEVEEVSALQMVETILRQSNAPPCAIINEGNDMIYVHGHIGRYLETPEGKISVNILEMARSGLRSALTSAITKVAAYKQEVYYPDLKIEDDDGIIYLNLMVKPIFEQGIMHSLMMVVFEEITKPGKKNLNVNTARKNKMLPKTPKQITRELEITRENLQASNEALETSIEELKSTNEELQSTNEELQSTNEEMETSKEELQSLNEESITINAELQSRIDELSHANDDMKNLLDSTDIATIFLDAQLCIRRYTPKAADIVSLTTADAGRPIMHLTTILIDVDLVEYSKSVLEDLTVKEVDVKSRNGLDYCMKVRPYRTINNLIDGVVITFENITERKKAEQVISESILRYRMLFDLASNSIVLLDAQNGCFKEFNKEAHEHLGYTREEFEGMTIQDIDITETSAEMQRHIAKIIASEGNTFETKHRTKNGTILDVLVQAKAFPIADNKYLLASWYDIEK